MVRLLPENTYRADPALKSLLKAWLEPEAFQWAEPQMAEMGRAAAAELRAWGEDCEARPPVLRTIEPWGDRVDEVVYPDAWKRLAAVATSSGTVAIPYEAEPRQVAGAGARVVQMALCYLFAPGTATYHCPVAMTDAAVRVLEEFGPDSLREEWIPHLVSRDPDTAWSAGQWMTEQQGGSDVGLNSVTARRQDGHWELSGRKFFCSNVGGEMVLALARPEGAGPGTRGLGLFLVPRILLGGRRNSYRIDRLKDKLGTRAMATGEVTLERATAFLVGELENGFSQMTPMLNITRLHNAIAAAAGMRRGLQLARTYAAQRVAFGKRLEELPLQRQVLTEMAVKAEVALVLTMRLALLLGRIETGVAGDQERLLFRAAGSLVKLYTAKLAVAQASEAVEAFGGQGYMEDTSIARLLRDAQVLPIWEGTTNVLSLDLLRVLSKPGVAEAFLVELERLGSSRSGQVASLMGRVSKMDGADAQRWARRLALTMADAWTLGLLEEAAARGSREAAVAGLWAAGGEPPDLGPDVFDLVVDGIGQAQPAPA